MNKQEEEYAPDMAAIADKVGTYINTFELSAHDAMRVLTSLLGEIASRVDNFDNYIADLNHELRRYVALEKESAVKDAPPRTGEPT